MLYLFIFMIGAIWGSFLNVNISRLPIRKSIVTPRSSCPNCQQPIKPYLNIPIISYILLRGKCSYCNWHIPLRYLMVEILTALLFVLLYVRFQFSGQFFVYAIFCSILIVITFIDIEHTLILNRVTFPGIVLGCGLAFMLLNKSPLDILIGGIGGGLILLTIALIGKALYKKESMGGGDIKLAVMIGSFLGIYGVLISLSIAILSGASIGWILSKIYKTDYIPFGPFISFGVVCYIFYSAEILQLLTNIYL